MTPAKYQATRKRLGTQEAVAALLAVDPQTVSRRERGELPITREAWLALLSLPKTKRRTKPQNAFLSEPLTSPHKPKSPAKS